MCGASLPKDRCRNTFGPSLKKATRAACLSRSPSGRLTRRVKPQGREIIRKRREMLRRARHAWKRRGKYKKRERVVENDRKRLKKWREMKRVDGWGGVVGSVMRDSLPGPKHIEGSRWKSGTVN